MEAQRRLDLIQEKLDFLLECSTNFDQVISKLVGFKVINNDTAEGLQVPGLTNFKQFSELYHKHILKPSNPLGFNGLLIAYISLNNIQAVQLLTGKSIDDLEDIGVTKFTHPKDFTVNVVKGPAPERVLFVESISLNKSLQPLSSGGFGNNVGPAPPSPLTPTPSSQVQLKEHDIPISEFDLLKIGDVLQQSPKIYEKWPIIVRRLLVKNKGNFDKPNDKTLDIWINDTLEEWVSLDGDEATLAKFLECLRLGKCTQAAELLEKGIKDIKK